MKIVLAVNAGSSSVKISVFAVDARGAAPRQLAEAQVRGLTAPPARLDYTRGADAVHHGKQVELAAADASNVQDAAFVLLLATLVDDGGLAALAAAGDVAVVVHRIVHGGDYAAPQHISPKTLHQLDRLSDLAPLHNAPALHIVRTCLARLPAAANVACFDSQFHASMPPHVATYPIDQDIARANMLRKYGFHGISYSFIARAAAKALAKPAADTNIIALHLGSGASACAIRAGRSLDTSMGLTPLAGLPGATRSGSIDPSLVFHYASDVGRLSPSSTRELHICRAEEILNKEAGWKALTGTTDFAHVAAAVDDDPRCRLAFDLFVDRVCAFVGSYYVSLHGRVDALVFAGGIGERSALLRRAVVDQCACLGFALDPAANDVAGSPDDASDGPVTDISAATAAHRVLVCRTDEQFEMARWCADDAELWASG